METGKSYPLAVEGMRLRVEPSADSEGKRLTLHSENSRPAQLDTSIRHFGYAWSPPAPEYLVVFNNYASRENSVRIYRFRPETEELYYKFENTTDARCAWSVKTWTPTRIILEGTQEAKTKKIYCTIPLLR